MAALPALSVQDVQMMVIEEICYQSKPCAHACKIKLQDGREKTVTYLSACKIDVLIQNMALDRLSSGYSALHFSKQRQGELGDAGTILNEVFASDD